MEEAERLADRIAVIAGGRIVAEGTPKTLGGRNRAAAQITYTTPDGPVTVASTNVAKDLHEISGWALENGVELEDLEVRRPTLEDVYLNLTNTKEPNR
jgi:ABC-2 type transport system ATP-binding protein